MIGQLALAQDINQGEETGFPGGKGSMTLPFRMVGKLILIPVQINGSDTLQFIFDTGLENSIICELEADKVLELRHAKEVRVKGIGSGNMIDAIQSKGNSLRVGHLTIPDQDYYILSNHSLQLSRKMGTRIHGLLNLHAFEQYAIEIDYERRYLTLYQPGFFREHKALDGYASLEMDIINGAPCIKAAIRPDKHTSYPVKLMLDTGAGNALSLHPGSLPGYSIPDGSRDDYLGCNINGQVKGKVGRMKGLDIGPYHLSDVPVSFPDPVAGGTSGTGDTRNGSLGADFLGRFNLIIDYPGRKIHIMANRSFEEEFHYGMSGIEIWVPVPDEHRYIIARIRQPSRAAMAGIRSGDEILSINGTPCGQLSLDDVYRRLLGKDGKKISMELLRKGHRITVHFHLENYI